MIPRQEKLPEHSAISPTHTEKLLQEEDSDHMTLQLVEFVTPGTGQAGTICSTNR